MMEGLVTLRAADIFYLEKESKIVINCNYNFYCKSDSYFLF